MALPNVSPNNANALNGWICDVINHIKDEFDEDYDCHLVQTISVSLLARCLTLHTIPIDQLQRYAAACIAIAVKWEVDYSLVGLIRELAYLTADSYSPSELAETERSVLSSTNWSIISGHITKCHDATTVQPVSPMLEMQPESI